MNMKTVSRNFTIPCLVLFIIAYYLWGVKSVVRHLQLPSNSTLIIGILSAPANFEQRLSIRNTWLKLTSNISAEYYFLIGKKYCDVHPLDRKNENSCKEADINLPKDVTSKTMFKTIKRVDNPKMMKSVETTFGFGFVPLFEIVITEIGVTSLLLKTVHSAVRVSLTSSINGGTIASSMFAPIHNSSIFGQENNDFITKKITPVLLPVHFEASVSLEIIDFNDLTFGGKYTHIEHCKEFTWNYQPGVLDFIQIFKKQHDRPWVFTNNSCTHVFMSYLVPGVDEVHKHSSLKSIRRKEWKDYNEKLGVLIKKESIKHNDIMFLDLIDVYENLPEKMLKFYKRLTEKKNYQFVLKTDDDTFIDILRVYKNLKKLNIKEEKLWWWSYFREFWYVDKHGKWRGDNYRSRSYPPFPCGGGYVINKNIVDYIVRNLELLERFQGEDVSLGIWLGGLSVIRDRPKKLSGNNVQKFILNKYYGRHEYKLLMLRQCPKFQTAVDNCQWTCDNKKRSDLPFCNKVQLNISGMYEAWENFTSRGFL